MNEILNLAKGVHKPCVAICIDDRNEPHSIARIKYNKNGVITTADLVDPWNYKDWISGGQIKLVAYKKRKDNL